MGYITVDDLKPALDIDHTDPRFDSLLEVAIDAAGELISLHCDRPLTAAGTAVEARVFRADDPGVVSVNDIGSTEDLVVATDEDGDGVFETTWSSNDFQLEPLNGLVAGVRWPYTRIRAVNRRWPIDGKRALIQVTARWGWPVQPAVATQACLIQAARLYKRKDSPLGVAGFGDFGPVRVSRVDPDVQSLLDGFLSIEGTVG